MSETGKENASGTKSLAKKPQSLAIAERGITTGNDFAQLMSTIMSDLIAGRITPGIANAVCNAGGKLLKVVEMRHRYGNQANEDLRTLNLTE